MTGATATPIANSITEMYVMQRYLDPDGMASAGIHHFDQWAATFGEVVTNMEINLTGTGFQPKSRFAKFTNVPELLGMFHRFGGRQPVAHGRGGDRDAAHSGPHPRDAARPGCRGGRRDRALCRRIAACRRDRRGGL